MKRAMFHKLCLSFAVIATASAGDGLADDKDATPGRAKVTLRKVLDGPDEHFMDVAFSPDGKLLAAGNMDGTVRLWDTATWKPVPKPFVHPTVFSRSVFSLAFSPDGKTLASVGTGWEGDLRVWDVAAGKERWKRERVWYPNCVAFSPDGKALALSTFRTLYLLDAAGGKELWSAPIDPGMFSYIAFSPDGDKLVSGGKAFTHFRVWDVKARKELAKVELNKPVFYGSVHALAFTGKDRLAIGSLHTDIGVWDLGTLKKVGGLVRVLGIEGRVLSLAVSRDRRLLCFSGSKGDFGVFSLKTSARLVHGVSGEADVNVALSPDGKLLATTGWSFTPGRPAFINIWELDTPDQPASEGKR